jgi:hypothetical protein
MRVLLVWLVFCFPAATPASARGQTESPVDSALVFHPTYVRSSIDYFVDTPVDADSVGVVVLGTVTGSRLPIEGLPVDRPGTEITVAVTGLQFQNAILWDCQDFGGISYEMNGGWFRVFADDTPDADPADPSTYEDGELLLEGTVTSYATGLLSCLDCPSCVVHNEGLVEFTGGSLFPSVSRDGVGYRAWFTHDQSPAGDPLSSQGVFTTGDGRLMIYVPTPVRPATWGRVKALFGDPGARPIPHAP